MSAERERISTGRLWSCWDCSSIYGVLQTKKERKESSLGVTLHSTRQRLKDRENEWTILSVLVKMNKSLVNYHNYQLKRFFFVFLCLHHSLTETMWTSSLNEPQQRYHKYNFPTLIASVWFPHEIIWGNDSGDESEDNEGVSHIHELKYSQWQWDGWQLHSFTWPQSAVE